MYPTGPTLEQWRLAAAKMARDNGVPVPSDYNGTTAAIQALNAAGRADITAALVWMQNAYVVQNPGSFPAAHLDYAKNFIAKNPSASAWAGGFEKVEYGLGAMLGDFVKEALWTGTTPEQDAFIDGSVKAAGDLIKSPLNALKGKEAVKADPKGFAAVVVTGVVMGATLWFAWKHFAKKGA